MDFSPTNHEEIESQFASRLANVPKGSEASEEVEWRGTRVSMPVLPFPLDLLYFNPHTRRIQAQLTVDPKRQAVLVEDPYSDVAQGYLSDLLKWDPASPGTRDKSFERLKESLRDYGQDEVGIVTRQGVLINGNTRAAALRELGQEVMRVAVLPLDADRRDIDRIELALQLRKSHKRDYSFVNELMAIRDEKTRGTSVGEICKAFRMKPERYERSLWLLEFIEDAVKRSRSADSDNASGIATYYFERDQGQLEELYRAWKALEADPEKASKLRETRLMAMVLQFAKTDLRVMDETFFESYVKPKLAHDLLPDPGPMEAPQGLPGLPDVTVPDDSAVVRAMRALTDRLLKAEAVRITDLGLDETSERLLTELREVFYEGRYRAGAGKDLRQKASSPAERVLEAVDSLDDALRAIEKARAVGSLDIAALEDALEELRKGISSLAEEVADISDSATDIGFAWLKAAASLDISPSD